jgi:hypothetical protein
LGLRSGRSGWQKSELPGSGERIVPGDVAQLGKERRTVVDGGTHELAERMLGRRARQELAAADGQGPEQQQSLLIFSQFANVVGQELDRASVLIQTFSSSTAW